MILFCKSKYGNLKKVGELSKDPTTGKWSFIKHKPHLMKIIGPGGGYGIQREVYNEEGQLQDIIDIFRGHQDAKVIIHDEQTGKKWVSSVKAWLEHEHKGNYGEGLQIFLSTEYMEEQK